MCGLGSAKSRQRKRFCAAFWPALWAGAVASLLTGIAVGLVVFQFQEYFKHDQAIEGYKRELSQLKFNIGFAVAKPGFFTWESAVLSTPPESAALMQLLSNFPLSLWQASLPEEAAFFNQMSDFQVKFLNFQNSAVNLDQELAQFARRYAKQHGIPKDSDPLIKKYVFAKLQDIEERQFLLFESIGNMKMEVLEDALAEAKIDRLFSGAHNNYKMWREALLGIQNTIKSEYLK